MTRDRDITPKEIAAFFREECIDAQDAFECWAMRKVGTQAYSSDIDAADIEFLDKVKAQLEACESIAITVLSDRERRGA